MIQPAINPPLPVKKAKWTADEDFRLSESIQEHGMSNWSRIAQNLPGRNGKQCRERWMNQLCPSLNRDNWSHQEDLILLQQQRLCGNQWSQVAHFLPGRSANAVKNRWSWLSRHGVSPPFAPVPMPPPAPRSPPAAPLFVRADEDSDWASFERSRPVVPAADRPIAPAHRPITFSDPGDFAPPLSFEKEFDLFSSREDDRGGFGGPPGHAHTFDTSALARFDEWSALEL
jgi:hypothetical protein